MAVPMPASRALLALASKRSIRAERAVVSVQVLAVAQPIGECHSEVQCALVPRHLIPLCKSAGSPAYIQMLPAFKGGVVRLALRLFAHVKSALASRATLTICGNLPDTRFLI